MDSKTYQQIWQPRSGQREMTSYEMSVPISINSVFPFLNLLSMKNSINSPNLDVIIKKLNCDLRWYVSH